MKERKAPEHLCVSQEMLVNPPAPRWSYSLTSAWDSKMPEDWNTIILILFYKEDNSRDMNIQKLISLLSTVYKLFTKIIASSVTQLLDEKLASRTNEVSEKLFYYWPSIRNKAIEKTNEYRAPLAVAHDFTTKAFGFVERKRSWQIWKNREMPRFTSAFSIFFFFSTARPYSFASVRTTNLISKGGMSDKVTHVLFTASLERAFKRMVK